MYLSTLENIFNERSLYGKNHFVKIWIIISPAGRATSRARLLTDVSLS